MEFNVSKETYTKAAKYIVEIVNNLKNNMDIFNDCILNINIPNKEVRGTKITILGERKYENDVEERVSPNGKKYIWIGGTVKQLEQEENSDVLAVENGYISVTPINIDMTNKNKIKDLENLI